MPESPGTDRIENLLKSVHDGSYVIPYFQRGFEWVPSMVSELLESILQNYYAGILLFWELNKYEVQIEKWDPIWGAELKKTPPEKAILDGQQRLASLYYAIYNPKKKFPNRNSYYIFNLNLNSALNEDYDNAFDYRRYSSHQTFNHLKKKHFEEWAEQGFIPICVLSEKDPKYPLQKYIDSKEFNEWINLYLSKNNNQLPEGMTSHKVYQLFNKILNYTFVYYPLSSERDIADICNIFAKVNEKGMKLSTFDLMNAFLYPKGVKLRKDLWDNYNNEALKSVDSNMNEYLLKLSSLVRQNYCSSKFLFYLIPGKKILRKDQNRKLFEEVLVRDGDEFKALWRNSCKYAEKARKIIMNTGNMDFGAIKTSFISNTTIVPVLGAILSIYEGNSDNLEFRRNLKKWYWQAVLSEDYSGSSDSIMSKDFREWKDWMKTGKEVERIAILNPDFINKLNLKNCRKGSARYNAILCLLALNDARDFFKGQIVGIGDYMNETIDDHHIFPKGITGLDKHSCRSFDELKDCILNRTLLLDETDIKIRNKRPSQYLSLMIERYNKEAEAREILRRHFINEAAFEHLKVDNFDSFIEEREKAIKDHIISMVGITNED